MKLLTILALVLAGTAWLWQRSHPDTPSLPGENDTVKGGDEAVTVRDLDVPWEMVWLPGGEMLVTERSGRLLLIGLVEGGQNKQIITVEGVRETGEAGLLGLALHPDFAANRKIYLYLTYASGDGLKNRVEAYQLNGSSLSGREVIVDGILGAPNHDGGRIAFGPEGKLYVATGDAQQPELAQDKNSLNGKILRVNDDGSDLEVYSYGHRNVQGLAWDSQGRLWATEHGPSGTNSGWDEVNLISQGGNYGWPEIRGDATRDGMISPAIHSGAKETWAPSGMIIAGDRIFFTGLRGETLYSVVILDDKLVDLERHFAKRWGRLRTITPGPDGWYYLLTNNRDGRGQPRSGDDKIIKINL